MHFHIVPLVRLAVHDLARLQGSHLDTHVVLDNSGSLRPANATYYANCLGISDTTISQIGHRHFGWIRRHRFFLSQAGKAVPSTPAESQHPLTVGHWLGTTSTTQPRPYEPYCATTRRSRRSGHPRLLDRDLSATSHALSRYL